MASVPQRSPFRYPGGKTWLVPRIRKWLYSKNQKPAEFFEPFAGGANASLTAAFENLAEHVTFVERDAQVSAVWHTIIDDEGGAEWLADQIASFELTAQSAEEILLANPRSTRKKAFQTILKNRINHGGILAPGAGVLNHGENGKGIKSRWYPETLSRRIKAIGEIRGRFTFIEGDGFSSIELNAHRADVVFFIDPPYTASKKKAGTRLYTYHEVDHLRLFDLAQCILGDFLLTYDNAEEVRQLALDHEFDMKLVAMSNTHHAKMRELLIGPDLDWVRTKK